MPELSKLGRYELRRILGKGAMGMVYEGFDPFLNRTVAVKTILKSAVTDEETAASYSARFAREAKAAGRLSHPHIVQVYDFGEENDIAYLAMEFIQGRELRSCFEARQRFDPVETVRIMGELLDALEFAHQAGVIHRDVKPANIMLDEQRRVKLADFGVARLQDGSERSKSGAMVGTPAFMSPEQVSGGRLDRRSDVFSAGIVLYQLLTNELPFKGDGAWTVAKQIMQDEPPRPSTVATRVSPAFDLIVNRALAKKPDQRFASAKEFASALQGALAGDAAAGAQRGSDAEVEFWRSIQGSNDSAEFEVYLKEFPKGVYADLARIKIAKLPSLAAVEAVLPPATTTRPPQQKSVEVAKLAEETAKLEADIAQREAEYRKREAEHRAREAEAETKRQAEDLARAEAEERREAQARERAEIEEEARLAAIETAKEEAKAASARREAEYRKREAEALAKAEAEAQARRAVEERVKREAEAQRAAEESVRRKAEVQHEADARARIEAQERARRHADELAKRQAEIQRREAELELRVAQGPRSKVPLVPTATAFLIVAAVAFGGWYWSTSSDEARLATLVAALDAATKATQELNLAKQRQDELNKQVEVARAAEEDARAKGDQAKLKELQEKTKLAEAEAQKQNDLVKQREAEAKKTEDATRMVDSKKQGEAKREAERAVQERAAQEKAERLAAEKAAADKLAAEKAAADKLAAEKAAADKLAAEKVAAPKPVAPKAPGASGRLPAEGDRWVYEARETNHPQRNFQMVVSTLQASSSSVNEFVESGKSTGRTMSHTSGPVLQRVSPGVWSFSPAMYALQDLRGGEIWEKVEGCRRAFWACSAKARVVSKERVTVKAGTYEATKVVVELSVHVGGSSGSGELTYWYADEAKRLVKFQSFFRLQSRGTNPEGLDEPNMDLELLSYVPAAQKAAAQTATVAMPSLVAAMAPAVGDRWVYDIRDAMNPALRYQADVEVLSAGPSGIRDVFRSPGGAIELVHQRGVYLDSVAPGILNFASYVRAFQELRAGESWAGVEMRSANCEGGIARAYCSVSARVAGREKVAVRAGTFDTWRILVEIRFSGGFGAQPSTGQFLFWYAEDAKRVVKYQSRVNTMQWRQPDVDMELISYTPAGPK